eukprot:Phypoly_transcript_05449.p1 GENE.Phypoly_transcript_05449~~Phypoly_transcript_05449.p1  ORF type:complete len:629 (+),score=84.62 Phypoly_transcript_05449:75-1889(+)
MAFWHLLLVLLVAVSECALVQYNSTVDCSSVACDFGDAAIWNDRILPTVNDSVEVVAPLDGKIYNFTVTTNATSYANFLIQNINLIILTRFPVTNYSVISNSNVTINANSSFWPRSGVSFQGASNISVLQYGVLGNSLSSPIANISIDNTTNFVIAGSLVFFTQSLDLSASFITTSTSSFTIFCTTYCVYSPRYISFNSYPQFYNIFIPGNSEHVFPKGASFVNLTLGDNANVTLMERANIYNIVTEEPSLIMGSGSVLNLVNVYASPVSGDSMSLPSGLGSINVVSSELYFMGSPTSNLPAVPLSFSGSNNATFFNSVIQNINFEEDANVHFYCKQLTLVNNQSTPQNIPGNLEVFYGSLIFNGSFSFTGGLEADVAYVSSIGSNITFGGPVSLYGITGYPSTWNLSSSLTTSKLTLYNSSLLRASSDLQINGNLENQDGTFQIDWNHFVLVNGEYTQGSQANLTLLQLDTNRNSSFNTSARLTVAQSAIISGQVYFTHTVVFENFTTYDKWALLQVLNGTINGTFEQKAVGLQGSIKTLEIDYSVPDFVYLVNDQKPGARKLGPLTWYYWVIIGVGAFVVIAVIAILAWRATNRKGYDELGK